MFFLNEFLKLFKLFICKKNSGILPKSCMLLKHLWSSKWDFLALNGILSTPTILENGTFHSFHHCWVKYFSYNASNSPEWKDLMDRIKQTEKMGNVFYRCVFYTLHVLLRYNCKAFQTY